MLGTSELIVVLFIFATIGGSLWGMLDAARRPNEIFRAAGQSKALWIVLQFMFAPLGTLLYALLAWPLLKRESERAEAAARKSQGPTWY